MFFFEIEAVYQNPVLTTDIVLPASKLFIITNMNSYLENFR